MEQKKHEHVRIEDYRRDSKKLNESISNLDTKIDDMDRRNTERHHENEIKWIGTIAKFENLPGTLDKLNDTLEQTSKESREQRERIYKVEHEQRSQRETLGVVTDKFSILDELEKKKLKDNKAIIIKLIAVVGAIAAAAIGAEWLWM